MATVQRRRYTQWFVTVNTNHAARSQAEEAFLLDKLEAFVRGPLSKSDTWRHVIKIKPNWSAVDTIRLESIGLERGGKRHFIHMHFVLLLEHHGKAYLKAGGAQRNLQTLLKQFMPYLRGPYVQIKPMDASHLNYVAKDTGTQKAVAGVGIQAPVTF